jgi:DNA modification methylase
MNAEQIPLFKQIESAKRGQSEKFGLHTWLNYYAGFSEAFVSSILKEFPLKEDSVILDPMNGSGTTTVVLQKQGYLGLGIELNPAMAIIARAKDMSIPVTEVMETANRAIHRAKINSSKYKAHSDTSEWIPPNVFNVFKKLEQTILETEEADSPLPSKLQKAISCTNAKGGRLCDFLYAGLLLALRRCVTPTGSKNPTWLKPGQLSECDEETVYETFLDTLQMMMEDLEEAFPDSSRSRSIQVLQGDARGLPLQSESVDLILTSPPYLTRIDYAVSTKPELLFLGYESKKAFRDIRRSIMGSTCIVDGEHQIENVWGDCCLGVLEDVEKHPSKASATYYLKTHIQYFRDAYQIIGECLRVLKPGGSAVFVVQDSWYKDVHIPLAQIYIEMAMKHGASHSEIAFKEHVKSHLGLVNSRARKYKKGKLHESVVIFRK